MRKIKKIAYSLNHYHHFHAFETVISLVACVIILTGQAAAVVRFTDRSLMLSNATPSATSTYTLSMQYTTQTSIGSLRVQFCLDPIPYMPCDPPVGLNVADATLESQTGETGYSITQRSSNELVLSRTPSVVAGGGQQSTYVFSGITNPSETTDSFAARLDDYASTDGSGNNVDLGSVETEITSPVELESQVPPMLIFCAAQEVDENCLTTNDNNYTDLGTLSSTDTLYTQSQMAAGTNASVGYVITANGPSMEAGNSVISSPASPTTSQPGTNQFGINLVANTNPNIGADPDLTGDTAQPDPLYSQPNKYMYTDGGVVAEAPNVSLVQRFTISYILNSSPNLAPGVYNTTITYICSGRF
jgi:hypothetical protein